MQNLPQEYSKFIKPNSTLCGPEFHFWKEDRSYKGIVRKTVTCYRPAILTNDGILKWIDPFRGQGTHEDTFTFNAYAYACVVKLQVPARTQFQSINNDTHIGFKFFDEVIVKDILAYYDKSILEEIMPKLKESPFTNKGNGFIVEPTNENIYFCTEQNFLYQSTAWSQCTHLKVMLE
jgi:hypothetical protein